MKAPRHFTHDCTLVSFSSSNVTVHFKNIPVTVDSTATDVLDRALKKFGCEDEVGKYKLVEMLLDRGVSERELKSDEKPWLIVKRLRRVG